MEPGSEHRYHILKNILGDGLHKNVSLKRHTTFNIGGPAAYFYTAQTSNELIRAVVCAEQHNVPYYVLGSGANVLVSDKGFDGFVIRVQNNDLNIDGTTVTAGAGVSLGKLVITTVKQGLTGLECWAGIPGTVGGSVYGNMGLPGEAKGEISDWLRTVTVLRHGKKKVLSNKECGFAYRHSVFKQSNDVILEAMFALERSQSIAGSVEKMKAFQKKKLASQPLGKPSSGCIFKNPPKVSAGKLIDELGLKGKTIGGAQISEKHANFIYNTGSATAEDVVMLISLIKQKVRNHYNIQLQEEINYVGF